MILVDTNVLMYAAGKEHPHKAPSKDLLRRIGGGAIEAVIDVEVLQEVLHRYRSIGAWEAGREVYDLARTIFPTIVPIGVDATDRARELTDEAPSLNARDALHAAVAEHLGASAICSYDDHFDAVPRLKRLQPHQLE